LKNEEDKEVFDRGLQMFTEELMQSAHQQGQKIISSLDWKDEALQVFDHKK
jgi:hypothetical protein